MMDDHDTDRGPDHLDHSGWSDEATYAGRYIVIAIIAALAGLLALGLAISGGA